MEEKALVLDIDGTLTNSDKEITENTKRGILETMKRGHRVILASGRPTQGMRRYATELELALYNGYLLSFNGARIENCKTGEIIYQQILPMGSVEKIYEFAKKVDCGLITYLGEDIIALTRIDEYIEFESKITGMKITTGDCESLENQKLNKMLISAPPEKAKEYEKILLQLYGDILSIYRSEPFYIEIMPKNVDKASALDILLKSIGLTKDAAICCGDGFNDKTMIEYAGLGVAMGNAQSVIKGIADYVTKSNDEDGVAHVIEQFIL